MILTQALYFFHVLCLCAGSMVVLLSFMFLARRRDYWLRYYLAFVVAFFLLMLFQTIRFFYDLSAGTEIAAVSRVFTGLFLLVLNFMIYLVPYFATWLTRLPWKRGMQAIFIPLACAYFALSVLFIFVSPGSVPAYTGLVIIFAVMIAFSMVLIVRRRDRIASGTMRNLCVSFVALSALFCPLIMADAFLSYVFSGYASTYISGVIAFPLYFMWFSVIAIIYLVSYFVRPRAQSSAGPSQARLDELKMTEREREIIRLLAQGLTYKEIGAKLSISSHTVNNHVANIYAKAGASSRIDLLRCLS